MPILALNRGFSIPQNMGGLPNNFLLLKSAVQLERLLG